MSTSRANVCVVGFGLLLVATMIAAQEGAAPKRQPGRGEKEKAPPPARVEKADVTQPVRADQGASKADSQLAACLIVDNQGEIAIAQLAEQKSQNKEIQAFAQKMVEDHQKMISDLQRFAGAIGHQPRATNRLDANEAKSEPRVKGNRRDENRVQPGASAPIAQGQGEMGLDFIALKRELGQKCVESTQTEMEKKEGAEFDKCFAFHQVMVHMRAIDTMEVFKGHASGELQTVLTEGLQVAQTHLQHAKDLAKKVEGSHNPTTATTAPAKTN